MPGASHNKTMWSEAGWSSMIMQLPSPCSRCTKPRVRSLKQSVLKTGTSTLNLPNKQPIPFQLKAWLRFGDVSRLCSPSNVYDDPSKDTILVMHYSNILSNLKLEQPQQQLKWDSDAWIGMRTTLSTNHACPTSISLNFPLWRRPRIYAYVNVLIKHQDQTAFPQMSAAMAPQRSLHICTESCSKPSFPPWNHAGIKVATWCPFGSRKDHNIKRVPTVEFSWARVTVRYTTHGCGVVFCPPCSHDERWAN